MSKQPPEHDDAPVIEQQLLFLTGGEKAPQYHGEFVGTYVKWPTLGVAMMLNLQRMVMERRR